MRGASIVREARLRAGLTQKQLAHRLGTKQSVISRWESGSSSPTLETLAAILRAVGLELHLRLADRDDHDLTLALLNRALSPDERIERMVQG
ncbi:MAG: helix-turn-helix domain-containing protein, partial [Acidimicrobiia bacterium]